MSVRTVRCTIIDRNLRLGHGDYLMLEEGKAQALADKGLVSYDGYTPLARTLHGSHGFVAASTPGPRKGDNETAPVSYLQRDRWMPHKALCRRPRVLWVQDRSKLGGAEISNDTVVAIGETLGYDIIGVSPGHFPAGAFAEADFAVLNNMHEFNPDQLYALLRMCHETRLPYVKYEHDYREISRRNVSIPLFQRARLCVFISPRHEKLHAEALGAMSSIALPLAIDVDSILAAANGIKREDNLGVVPSPQKCGADLVGVLSAYKDLRLIVVGGGDIAVPKGIAVEGIPKQSIEGMAKLFARARYCFHVPEKEWAGERVVIEAALCGVELVTNERVGHMSWLSLPDADTLRAAPYKFWSGVESACM